MGRKKLKSTPNFTKRKRRVSCVDPCIFSALLHTQVSVLLHLPRRAEIFFDLFLTIFSKSAPKISAHQVPRPRSGPRRTPPPQAAKRPKARNTHRGGRWGVTDPHSLHDSTLWNFFVHIVEKAVLTNCYYRNNNRPGRLFPQCGIFHNVKKSQGPPNPFKTWCPRLIMWNFPLCERFHNVNDFL